MQHADLAIVPVAELRHHPENPRRHDDESIRGSIREHGVVDVCVVQRSSGFILGGNGRYDAAVLEGATVVPVLYVDCSDDEAVEIMLVLNRTADRAGYDNKSLARLLGAIQGRGRLIAAGWRDDDVVTFLAKVDRRERIPPAPPGTATDKTPDYRCPSCSHEWSGDPKPEVKV